MNLYKVSGILADDAIELGNGKYFFIIGCREDTHSRAGVPREGREIYIACNWTIGNSMPSRNTFQRLKTHMLVYLQGQLIPRKDAWREAPEIDAVLEVHNIEWIREYSNMSPSVDKRRDRDRKA